jgi:hypothetical protein
VKAEHTKASLAELTKVVGGSKGNVSERLKQFAEAGWACGPRCCPSRRWR